jgi:hypothetical protein
MIWRRVLIVLLAVTGVGLLAGCGASSTGGSKRFSVSGITLHFRYPASFSTAQAAVATHAGGKAAQTEFLGLDRADGLGVLTYPGLLLTVTPKILAAVAPQINSIISKATGHPVTSSTQTVHGIPVLSFAPIVTKVPGGTGKDRIYYAFVGRTAYELICQYTAAHTSAIAAACKQMLSTLST